MVFITEEMINQLQSHVEKIDEPLKKSFQNIDHGHERETLVRFLKARDGNVLDAHQMLIDCLKWRIQNEIDNILLKPIDTHVYTSIRESQLVGISGYSKEPSATKKYGRYIGTCIKILDIKLSALSQIKILTVISTIDDLNYPEKTETYYIVNAPYIFAACWKVVKPLLRERTRKRVQVLSGSGRDDLLKIMDYQSLPHFCRREGSGSSRHSSNGTVSDCFSFNHPFHQQLYNYIKEQSVQVTLPVPIKQGSFHVGFPEPDPEDVKIAQTIENEFQRIRNQNGVPTHYTSLI